MAKPRLFAILALALVACTSHAASTPLPPDGIVTAVQTETLVATLVVPATPTATHLPRLTATPTWTRLPGDVQKAFLEYYELILLIQRDASVLTETAKQVDSGKLDVFGNIDRIAGLVELSDWIGMLDPTLSMYQPPDIFAASWGDALQVHETTRDNLIHWKAGEIDAKVVLEKMVDPLADIQGHLSHVEDILINNYGFDRNQLQAEHDDALASVSEFLNAPTRTPTPLPESLQQSVAQTYNGILGVYGTVFLINGLAQKVTTGTLPNSYAVEALLSTDILNGRLDQFLGEINPPVELDAYWRQALLVFWTVKDLATRWVGGEVDAGFVLKELPSTLDGIQNVLSGVEQVMIHGFGLDRKELEAWHNEYLAGLEKLLEPGSASEGSEGNLIILSSQSYIDGNVYKIIGEVQNTSTYQPFTFVEVIATLYDASNQVVATLTSYAIVNTIPPGGGKSPFELVVDNWEGVTSYTLEVRGLEGSLGRQDLLAINQTTSQNGNYLEISGEVDNPGMSEAEDVMIIATLYDAEGKVFGVGYAYTSPDNIPAGGTAPFVISTGLFDGFHHYELIVQGK